MGTCVSSKASKREPLPFVKQLEGYPNAAVIIEENFKIVDYTQKLQGVKKLKDPSVVDQHFACYRPIDIRCVKARAEGKREHSHLMVVFSRPGETDEIGVVIDYSRYGFGFTLGELKFIKEICNLKGSILELLLLPKAENVNKVTFGTIIEWAYFHKDEEYKNPKRIPELNMGKRIFRFISEKLSDEYASTKARI